MSRQYHILDPELAGGAIAPMAWNITDVRRNAQQGGTHMLCTTTTGLRRIAQPDDASPTQTTHALPGIQPALALQPVLIGPDRSTSTRHLGRRRYELTDHLGNVRAVVGDRKLSDFDLLSNPPVLVPTSFRADVLSYADYDPFGSLLDERHALAYRFGFQGQEQDDEIHDDPGTSYAYKYRMHDTRVGRFWSVDPLAAKYPWNSPYAFAENRVIDGIDLEGLEHQNTTFYQVKRVFLDNGDYMFVTSLLQGVGQNPSYEHNVPGATWQGIRQQSWFMYDNQLLDNPLRIPGYKEWVEKERAVTQRKVGLVAEVTGDVVQAGGIAVSALGAPEVGIPMMTGGEILSKGGVSLQVAADIGEKKYADASKKIAIEVSFDIAGSVAKMALDNLGAKESGQYLREAVTLGAENATDAAASSDEDCHESTCP